MSDRVVTLRRVLGIGVAWAALWLLTGLAIGTVIGFFDPDSVDPGEMRGVSMIFALMGFLSGAAFAIISALAERGTPPSALSFPRVLAWGTLATAIVQIGFLGHGDAGLAANSMMALLFCGIGGIIAAAWLALARRLNARGGAPAPS